MAKKLVDPFGKTPSVKTSISEARKRVLANDDWFVEYLNVDTRNAIAQGLELVDHRGDTIFYDGSVRYGFRTSFNDVLFLVNSLHNGVFKFAPYHKEKHEKNWRKWLMHMKAPQSILTSHTKEGRLTKR